MRITIGAVGILRGGPEYELIAHYQKALKATGSRAGITALSFVEVDDRKLAKGPPGVQSACEALLQKIPKDCLIVALDEGGQALSSKAFAARLQAWSQSHRDIAFLIGGADGLNDHLRSKADFILSLGLATWPHMLARAMLTEQIYRASTILCGHPYHRE